MIQLQIKNEDKKIEPEKVVTFEFRRHKQNVIPPNANLLYLIAEISSANNGIETYPIKIDGGRKKFIVRKSTIEKLGFELIIERDF